MCARRRSKLSLASPPVAGREKVTKEKATPLSVSPALRCGAGDTDSGDGDHALTQWAHGFAPDGPGNIPQASGCAKHFLLQALQRAKTRWQYLSTSHRVSGLVQCWRSA